MLTFLSQSIRRMFRTAPQLRALPAAAEPRLSLANPPRGHLRLVTAAEEKSTMIAVPRIGATAFVAGQGARIYSLDVFRKPTAGGPPKRAA